MLPGRHPPPLRAGFACTHGRTSDAEHSGAASGFQPDVGVFKYHALRRFHDSIASRLPETRPVPVCDARIFGRHHRVEPVANRDAVERARDGVAVAAAGDRNRQLPADRSKRWK